MNGVVFTVFLLDLASSMLKLFWKMLWGQGSEGGWCFACVMTEWGLRLQVVASNIYTTCDIVICLYVCCVSVYAYDRMKYCSDFFFCRLRMKFVLIKLKAKFSDLFLLLFSKLHHHWGEMVALRKSQRQNVFVPLSWTGRVILKLKKGDLRVCDFIFSLFFVFFKGVQTLSQLTPKMYGFMQPLIKSYM